MDGALTTVSTIAHITGELSAVGAITGELSAVSAITGELTVPTYFDIDEYAGEYEVNPDFDGVILPTMNKTLTQNISVNPIQVESVSNLSGGRTVYIGGII